MGWRRLMAVQASFSETRVRTARWLRRRLGVVQERAAPRQRSRLVRATVTVDLSLHRRLPQVLQSWPGDVRPASPRGRLRSLVTAALQEVVQLMHTGAPTLEGAAAAGVVVVVGEPAELVVASSCRGQDWASRMRQKGG